MVVEHPALVAERLRGHERHVPAVGVARRDAQRAALATAADPDREPRLQRAWLVARLAEGEPAALERGDLVVEQAADACRALLELVHARTDARKVDPIGVVLDLGPAGSEPDRGPAAGQEVDRRDRLGEHGRVPEAHGVHEGAALHP